MRDLPDSRRFLERLVDALRLAALPADQQIAALPDFVDVPDEVALLFDDAWELVPQIRGAGVMNDDQYAAVLRLDRLFDEMTHASDRDRLWLLDGLRRDERWALSRRLAAEALTALGRPLEPPRFGGITWVPGGGA